MWVIKVVIAWIWRQQTRKKVSIFVMWKLSSKEVKEKFKSPWNKILSSLWCKIVNELSCVLRGEKKQQKIIDLMWKHKKESKREENEEKSRKKLNKMKKKYEEKLWGGKMEWKHWMCSNRCRRSFNENTRQYQSKYLKWRKLCERRTTKEAIIFSLLTHSLFIKVNNFTTNDSENFHFLSLLDEHHKTQAN